MRSKFPFILLIFVGLLLQSFTPLAQEDTLKVVASQSILADVARNVAGDNIEVSALIPVGADPHSFIPSPGDLTTVANADLVLLVGAGYEETLLDAIVNAGEAVNIVDASACVEILPYGASVHSDDEHMDEHADEHEDEHAHEHEDEHADEHEDEHADEHEDEHADEHEDEHADEHEDEHADEHEDEHAHEHEDEHAHERDEMDMAPDCDAYDAEVEALMGEETDHDHDHDHFETLGRASEIDCGAGHGHGDEHDHHGHGDEGSCDPHLWMDPHNVIYWTLMIRDTLSALDHDHADSYAANADAYIQELVALESEFILPLLADLPAENRVLVTGHETLGYFAAVFDFELVTTIVPLSETMIEPSARDVAELIERVRETGVPAVFGDTYSPGRVLEVIAAETGVVIAGLYSDTLSDSDGPAATYLDYMRYNVSTIVDALKP